METFGFIIFIIVLALIGSACHSSLHKSYLREVLEEKEKKSKNLEEK